MQATLMSWDEIKAKYPDRWVALADYRKDGTEGQTVYVLTGTSDDDYNTIATMQVDAEGNICFDTNNQYYRTYVFFCAIVLLLIVWKSVRKRIAFSNISLLRHMPTRPAFMS